MSDDTGGRTGRRPGPVSTREELLAAARDVFSEHGYKGATVRAIAARAGVDAGLIRHFFGGKDGLFLAAMEMPRQAVGRVVGAFRGPSESWGEELARTYFSLWEDPVLSGPLRAVMVSAVTDERAAGQLRRLLTAEVLQRNLPGLRQDRRGYRVGLAMSHLFGTSVARYVFAMPPLAEPTAEELVASMAPTLQRYLTGDLD